MLNKLNQIVPEWINVKDHPKGKLVKVSNQVGSSHVLRAIGDRIKEKKA